MQTSETALIIGTNAVGNRESSIKDQRLAYGLQSVVKSVTFDISSPSVRSRADREHHH